MHAWLAGDAPADRIGGLIGDFVKGHCRAICPDIAAGVELHRRIDSFVETHPAFRASRARVSAERRCGRASWSTSSRPFHGDSLVPLSCGAAVGVCGDFYRLLADEPSVPERFWNSCRGCGG